MANDMTLDSRTLRFDPVSFFQGKTVAHGVFEDRRGRVRRRMMVDMVGVATGDTLTLDEFFAYDDGATERRRWTLTRLSGGAFRGTTDDCLGEPVGSTELRSSRIVYDFRLKLPKSGRSVVVRFDDRMHQINETTVVNRATVTKWGIKVGELFLVLQKVG